MRNKIIILTLSAIFSCSSLLCQVYLDSFGKVDSNFKIYKYIVEVENYVSTNDAFFKRDSNFIRNDLSIINAHFNSKLFLKLKCASAFKYINIVGDTNKIGVHFFELRFINKEDCQKAIKFFNEKKEVSWGKVKMYSNAIVKDDMIFLAITSQVRNKNLLEFINNMVNLYPSL